MIFCLCVCVCVMHHMHTNIIIFSVRNKFYIRTVIKVYEVLITTLRTNVRKENRTSKLKNIHTMCAFFFLNTNKQENIKIINYYSRLYALLLLLTYHTSSYIKLFTFLLPYLA